MKHQTNQIVSLLVSMVVVLAAGPGVFAGPTPPVVSGSVADFTGDQSGGVRSGFDFTCPPIYTLNVYDLTTDVGPVANDAGVAIVREASAGGAGANAFTPWPFTAATGGNGGAGGPGGEVIGQFPNLTFEGPTVNFTGGAFEIFSSGLVASGIYANSTGGNGGAGGYAESVLWTAWGGAGGYGGWGMPVAVASDGGIHATASFFATGIWAVSAGGNGGAGGATDSAEGAWGGAGGYGGPGLPMSVHNDGDISTEGAFSAGILATSAGGNGGVGGSAHTGGEAYGGQGGAGGDSGTVIVTNEGSIQADGTFTFGIAAGSGGGNGGDGGSAASIIYGQGGAGGRGGSAGPVDIDNYGNITITSTMDSSQIKGFTAGILGQSLGGVGGNGGSGSSIVGVGGSAQGGGSAGTADIVNTGTIHATGLATRGILAQSIGGFDGSGGSGGGVVGWGGSGRSSGDGALVAVTNSGVITTAGDDSFSILAQSLGGGGGDAGYSYAGGLAIAIGGTGSAAGSGGTVTVTNTDTGLLQASGIGALGIAAQSIGGGGGFGGMAGGFLVLGGSGNSSGNGGIVAVTNDGPITMTGQSSDSILAQSIGGGGGIIDGAGSIDIAFFGSIGGSGGAGGSGSTVTVNNSGDLQTSGDDASGIRAQSIGGGGGRGGWSFTGPIPPVTAELAVSALDADIVAEAFDPAKWLLGGGGVGGDGGRVYVTSEDAATISTAGVGSFGIHAQSVGGGGGTGRMEKSVQYFVSVAIGGDGGGGGNGDAVNVTSDSTITTQGQDAHGLFAQSIGGGGGAGGNASAVAVSLPLDTIIKLPLTIGAAVSEAGAGGAGGDGGAVTVNSTGDISTSGFRSLGIIGQSVGGGGGDGGNSVAEVLSVNTHTMTMAIGGAGGDGGNGGIVEVDSSGNVATQGGSAYGILAQSVGGGGGSGGYSSAVTFSVSVLTGLGDLFSPSLDLSLSVGGRGGAGGDGALVDVDTLSAGGIVTQADFAHGILAQSIGGGGGAGGRSTVIDIEISTNPADYLPWADLLNAGGSIQIGGSGGAAGNGGQADVTNEGSISSAGNFAAGIVAQSIGGGGGVAGHTYSDYYGFTGPGSSLVLGGSSGNHGDGGDVTVLNNGAIATEGGFAPGILAQSIGGGGGFAGISEDDGISRLNLGSNAHGISAQNTGFGVGFAGSTGGNGLAGAVSVTNTGSITTSGMMSHGILAQSATGYYGTAGPVSVTHTGSITTSGDMSDGILAQSAAGSSSTAGPVTVTLASDIATGGVDSDGIHAQSLGGSGNGDITIDNGGLVQGGSGAGAGVNIDGGLNNTLTNAGSISALSGTAIIGGLGNDTVNNSGIVTGTVDLGTGTNAFNNNVAGILNAGALIDLGAGNALTNAGILSPGGLGTILNTTVIGDLVQSASGVLELEIGGFTPGSFDSLDITGTLTEEVSLLSLSSTTGGINFSFLPGYDIGSEIGPGQSMTLQFLNADDLGGFASGMSYSVLGSPLGFQYDVFQQDGGLFLRAVNTVPAPGALLLGSIGLGLLGWARTRMRG